MIVTYNWLKEWIDFDLTWDSLPSVLRSLGIGVDKVEKKDNDIVYDLEITPNRPDLLGVLGIAREISAYTGNPLKKRISEYSFKGEPKLEVDIEDSADCARYILASIDGIEIKESPEWIKRKLEFAGLRSVNNIVDISNYVMLELGHPLHIFDKAHIDRIIVRRGRRGESILTLDGNEVALDEDILLICNSKEPIAIAGIIGGEHSGVKEDTRKIAIESAYFNPGLIRRGSRKLGIRTEASYRFERNADRGILLTALSYAINLILEYAGGEVKGNVIDTNPNIELTKEISINRDEVRRILDIELSDDEIDALLGRLSIKVYNEKVIIPSFRRDIEIVEDLAEEVGRLYGYDRIPKKVNTSYSKPATDERKWVRDFKNFLKGLGLNEVWNISFMDPSFEKRNLKMNYLKNPMWPELNVMRTTLFYGLLNSALRNLNRELEGVRLFEIGTIFPDNKNEEVFLAVLLVGSEKKLWYNRGRQYDFYDIKGIVENILQAFSITEYSFVPNSNPNFYSERSLELSINGERYAFGLLRQNIIEADAYGFEIPIYVFLKGSKRKKAYLLTKRFPPVKRDLSFIVPFALENKKVIDIIIKSSHLVSNVETIDVYSGKGIQEGKRSITYRLFFATEGRTLTSTEVEEEVTKILKNLREVKVTLRE